MAKRFFLWLIKLIFLSALNVGAGVGIVFFLWFMGETRSIYGLIFIFSTIAFIIVGLFALALLLSRFGVVTKEEYAVLPTADKVKMALKLLIPLVPAVILLGAAIL